MTDAVAKAAGVPAAEVRRALTLHGDLAADRDDRAHRRRRRRSRAIRLEVGRPLAPMLAGTATDVAAALEKIAPAAVDWKLDGARVQVHRDGEDVAIYTRSLDDVTARLPEVVSAALALDATAVVLDGEAIALRDDGRPEPFQVTASRFGTRTERSVPLASLFFDVLHVDGEDLLDEPLVAPRRGARRRRPARAPDRAHGRRRRRRTRRRRSTRRWPPGTRASSSRTSTRRTRPGRRGSGWLKVKPVHTLDLVILAAEWGHGRRQGKLSNLHLGARDGDGWAMLGKTFKGLTDEMLAWQTERLLALQTAPRGHRRPRPARARRRDRVRRRAALVALPVRPGAAVRARQGLPRGQERRPRPTRSSSCASSSH